MHRWQVLLSARILPSSLGVENAEFAIPWMDAEVSRANSTVVVGCICLAVRYRSAAPFFPHSANGVVLFQAQPDRVDQAMADSRTIRC